MHESRFQLAGGDRNVGTVYLPEEQRAPVPVLVVCFGGASHRQWQRPKPLTVDPIARDYVMKRHARWAHSLRLAALTGTALPAAGHGPGIVSGRALTDLDDFRDFDVAIRS